MSIQTLQRRLDAAALDQLRAEVARLAVENDRLNAENARLCDRANHAEDVAEGWRKEALDLQLDLIQQTGKQPGLTMDGRLVAA